MNKTMFVREIFIKTIKNAKYWFVPESNVAGLGRWSSTIMKNEEKKHWFHDMCNYDNCYSNTFKFLQNDP